MLEAAGWTGPCGIEPGGGKTALAVWSIQRSGSEVSVIVAPQGTHRGHGDGYEWHVQQILGTQVRFLNNGTKAGRQAFADLEFGVPGVYLITPQLFARTDWTPFTEIDMAIIDEVHLVAQGRKSRHALLGFRGKRGLSARYRIAMSGTPVRNKFQNWWSIMRWLWPEKDGYGEIADRVEIRWKDYRMTSSYSFFAHNNKEYGDEKEPGLLVSQMPVYIQHFRRRMCCAYHPNGFLPTDEPNVVREIVELDPEQRRIIRDLEKQSLAWLGEHPLVTELPVTTLQRIRQVTLGVPHITEDGGVDFDVNCKSSKLDRTLEILEELEPGEPVVIFTSSEKFATVTTARLNEAGYRAFKWSGKVSQRERDDLMARFQASEFQVAVVSLGAGGTGIGGFSKVAKTEIWLDRDLDGTVNVQAEARLDRLNSRGQVQRFLLLDSEGRDEGRLSQELEKRMKLNESNRRKVA
jgi:hypothetical protein